MSDWTPPPSFDSYRLVRRIGRGGMGEVHLAHDTLLDRPVAIKFISPGQADVEARKRFFVEARAIARLQHPNVVAVYRVGVIQDHPYLVSEFVAGQPLSDVPMPIPWPRALDVGVRLARALAAAHQRGVIHRDIKPGNVMLAEDGEPKLLDFGIAKLQGLSGANGAYGPATTARSQDAGEACCEPSAGVEPHGGSNGGADRPGDGDATVEVEVRVEPMLDGQLTQAGTVVGTLPYMAPEVLRGRAATCAADVYAFGALLYQLCSGHVPRNAKQVQTMRLDSPVDDPVALRDIVPGIDARLSDIVDRCLRLDPAARFQDGNELRAALSQLTPEARGGLIPEGNPFRGLRCFEAEHQGLFFGRDSEIRSVLDRLVEEPFVVVAGDSGLGKSSLCRAGILPRAAAWFGGSRSWSGATLVPGAHPVEALLHACGGILGEHHDAVMRSVADDPSILARSLRMRLGQASGLLLLVDQMEELSTLAAASEGALAADILGWLCEPSPSIRVLATVRSDFLGRVASLPRVGELASRSLYFLRPLSESRIRDAVVGPARAKGVLFDQQAVNVLVSSTVHSTGGLPLLQFALAELWDARDPASDVISGALLDSIGGVGGALSRHGDNVLASMPQRVHAAARRVLTRLVTSDRTRVRRSERDLCEADPDALQALAALVRTRLLVATESQAGTHYELAHEALVRGWSTLAGWLAATDSIRFLHERLAAAASDWERLGRSRHALWNRSLLGEIDHAGLQGLTQSEQAFLRASRSAALRSRLLRAGAVATIPLVIGGTWAALAAQAHRKLQASVAKLEGEASTYADTSRALAREASELRAGAFGAFERQDLDGGEKAWADSLGVEARLTTEYGNASQLLESALLLDPSRAGARRLLADVLYDRALAAERRRAPAEMNELLQRMVLYDAEGARRRAWAAPGTVELAVEPPDSEVVIEAVHGPAGPESPPPQRAGGPLSLPSGSYVARVQAAGRETVLLPFLLSRGSTVRLAVDLPAQGSLPANFVYVPAGTFLFGSVAEESLRRSYYRTVPLHLSETNAFLIARHETTYADWIAFLEALPPQVRQSRLPRVRSGGFQGALELSQAADGVWQLAIQPAQVAYKARMGQRLVYRGRTTNVSVDWSKLPVTGISTEDAEAYVAWLSSHGRVPRARMCSEKEWERAARGADGRPWPTGEALSPTDANIDATYAKSPDGLGPDEVGAHPSGRSVFGLDDMAGNAWEWTRSSLGPGYVARGGSYYYDANAARSSNREVPEPTFRDTSLGLRVCADPPPR